MTKVARASSLCLKHLSELFPKTGGETKSERVHPTIIYRNQSRSRRERGPLLQLTAPYYLCKNPLIIDYFCPFPIFMA